jgi:2,3-bisphosphoglycerate-dependent phosphoglycerate mutase
MSKLILIRHGQSVYNEKNLFTGWANVDLTSKGVNEANDAAPLLKNINFTHAFTSKLIRAQKTLEIILDKLNQRLEVTENIALNERDYGSLVGINKKDAAKKYGSEQVQIWRRSFSTPPPDGESLEMTADRTLPFFKKFIKKLLLNDENNIIISAHGNSIRAIVMYLHRLSSQEILNTEIGWCEPWIYEFENGLLKSFKIIPRPNDISNSNLSTIPTTISLI